MALHVSAAEVQSWLESTKTSISNVVDPDIEANASAYVLGALGQIYETSTWVDAPSTPVLVRKVIAMLIAAWYYERQYNEDSTKVSQYGGWLEAKAYALLTAITSGAIDLIDVVTPASGVFTADDFWPNDSTEVLVPNDAAAFTMAKVF